VQGVPFPEADQANTNYPIAAVKDAPQAELSTTFLDLVTGEFGTKTLEQVSVLPDALVSASSRRT
jgi:molybdate transport system substrate-binding protein